MRAGLRFLAEEKAGRSHTLCRSACSVAATYRPPMLVPRVRLPACAPDCPCAPGSFCSATGSFLGKTTKWPCGGPIGSNTRTSSAELKIVETRDGAGDRQIFSLTLSQLSYRGLKCCLLTGLKRSLHCLSRSTSKGRCRLGGSVDFHKLLLGPVAQWIRHRPTEPGIAGSSPAGVMLPFHPEPEK